LCAVLSQFGYHTEAIEYANKASVLSEDNIVKTYDLYSLIDLKKNEEKIQSANLETEKKSKDSNKLNEHKDENSESYIEKMIKDEKVTECELIMKALSILINKNRELHKNQKSSHEKAHSIPHSYKKITSKDEYSLFIKKIV